MRYVAYILFIWFCFLAAAYGETNGQPRTMITSDQMITESGQNRVRFLGHVEAHHDNMVLNADELEAYTDEQKEKLVKIIAVGAVKVVKGDRHLEGGRAELVFADKKVTLTGEPVVFEKQNRISGERIVYSYDNGGIMIDGGSGTRASVVLSDPKESPK